MLWYLLAFGLGFACSDYTKHRFRIIRQPQQIIIPVRSKLARSSGMYMTLATPLHSSLARPIGKRLRPNLSPDDFINELLEMHVVKVPIKGDLVRFLRKHCPDQQPNIQIQGEDLIIYTYHPSAIQSLFSH